MSRAIKIAVLILLVALVPLRGLAAATTGLCAFAHDHGMATHAHTDTHEHGHDSHGAGDAQCSSCAEHCAGTAFAPTSVAASMLMTAGAERAISAAFLALGLRAEPLDRPPLSR